MMMPGATPKLTRSARRVELRAEAGIGAQHARGAAIQHVEDHGAAPRRRPRVCQSSSSAKRMAVAPLHRPSKVRVEGTSLLMERSSSFSSRAATIWRARARRVPRARLPAWLLLFVLVH